MDGNGNRGGIRSAALRIAAIYVLFGGLWIVLSDRLLALAVSDAAQLTQLQTYKGAFYVLITGLLVFVLARRALGRQAELMRQLGESEERFRLGFDQAAVGIAHVAPDGRWIRVNRRLCETLGYSEQELRERTFQDITHPDDLDADLELVARVLAGEIDSYEMEKRYLRKDGRTIWARLTVSLVRDGEGRPLYFISAVLDTTDRHVAEDALRELNAGLEQRVASRTAQLEEANRELQSFSYSVSHDLKAPLRGIDGYSCLLEEDFGDRLGEEGRNYLHRIRRGVSHMHVLIEDLLAYACIERRVSGSTVTDLQALIGEIVAERESDIAEQRVTLHLELAPLRAEVDREGLQIALRNLLGNAIKFTRQVATPRIEIELRENGGKALIRVRDNGIGFDMRHHERIFEIFNRLERAEEYPGTGIGLALVRKAMQRMGGRVWAESAPGEGAAFHLEWPLEKAAG